MPMVCVLQNQATRLVLACTANKQVVMEDRNIPKKGGSQKWELEDARNDCYILHDRASGAALDNTNNTVYANAANTGNYQKWQLLDPVNGYYILQNQSTNFVLTSSASSADKRVYTSTLSGAATPQQRWQLIVVFS